jgi:membrane protease YdiL (CAAX protease family)
MPALAPWRDRAALALALVLPTAITLIYFVWMSNSAVYFYGPLKALQFSFPLFWIFIVRRERQSAVTDAPRFGRSALYGVAFGAAVLLTGWTLYDTWLMPDGFFDSSLHTIQRKVATIGLTTPLLYFICSQFYSFVHSLLEEYYWRWFVHTECRRHWSMLPAIAVSSLGFMAHHVVVLAQYFDWDSPYTYLLSLCVAIGGAFWAWSYEKYGTLLGPWLGHLLVDALIFAIGYDLVFNQ